MKKRIIIIGAIILAILGAIIVLHRGGSSKPRAFVAFVIDDWGYNQRYLDLVFQIDRPLTISVLPNLRYSADIAEAVIRNSRIHDIILHLPLESKNNSAAEIDTIRTAMGQAEVLSILDDDIKSIPGLVGVSNHQGSKATEDENLMRVILGELKKRNLFFLDSLTTPDSVCADVARDIGLRYARRDVFLDLTDQTDLQHFESYIKKQVEELAGAALLKGSAIGIGHNKRTTLKVIKDSIPELEKQGIKIVPLKELLE